MFVVGSEATFNNFKDGRIIKLMTDTVDFVIQHVPRLRAGVVYQTCDSDDAANGLATQVKLAAELLTNQKENALQWLVLLLPKGRHYITGVESILSTFKYHNSMVVTFVDLNGHSNSTRKSEILRIVHGYIGRPLMTSLHDSDDIVEFSSLVREFCKGTHFLQLVS